MTIRSRRETPATADALSILPGKRRVLCVVLAAHVIPRQTESVYVTLGRSRKREPIRSRVARYAWALLLARIYEAFPLLCPKCGGEMRIIAFITEAVTVRDRRVSVPW